MLDFKALFAGVAMVVAGAVSSYAECIPNRFSVGWLNAQELAGGNTIARHVGKTYQQLVQRLGNRADLAYASSFTDILAAELAITHGLSGQRSAINQWANNAASGQMRVDDFEMAASFGRGSFRPANFANTTRFRTIVRADGSGNCRLETSFPIVSATQTHSSPSSGYGDLASYLAAAFSSSDMANETDSISVVARLDNASLSYHKSALQQGAQFVANSNSDFDLIGDWANREFDSDASAKNWLNYVLQALSDGIDELEFN